MTARILYLAVSLFLSVGSSLLVGPSLWQSESAVGAIIDVFAILAGVLVAVISIIGDPAMLLPGNWRFGYLHAQQIQKRLGRFSHLFLLYLLTLSSAIIAVVLRDVSSSYALSAFYLLGFLASLSFIISLPLPYVLMSIQRERMEEVVRKRKETGSNEP